MRFRVEVTVDVEIEIPDEVMAESLMGEEDEGNRNMYGWFHEDEVAEHLAFNAIANGEGDGRRLDGFADLDYPKHSSLEAPVRMAIDRDSFYYLTRKVNP